MKTIFQVGPCWYYETHPEPADTREPFNVPCECIGPEHCLEAEGLEANDYGLCPHGGGHESPDIGEEGEER